MSASGKWLTRCTLGGLERRAVTEISGGQQQRVALARALIMRPDVLLLDEPLAALDLKLRNSMQQELRRIHRSIGGTFVFVTHDQNEAMGLANRIAVMRDGLLVQEGSPEEIYSTPRSQFVSNFVSEANVLPGRRTSGVVVLDAGATFPAQGSDGTVVTVVRPEAMSLTKPGGAPTPDGNVVMQGTVRNAVFLGSRMKYVVEVPGNAITVYTPPPGRSDRFALGDKVDVVWNMVDQRVLDTG